MAHSRRLLGVTVVILGVLLSMALLFWLGGSPPADVPADRAKVSVFDKASGEHLGSVSVRVAATPAERYRGLSNTTALPAREGMLFVYRESNRRTFVMRDMEYPLDIIFIDEDHRITAIHHAAVPPPGTPESELRRYSGEARWVLEVNMGWANRTGVVVGDRIEITYGENVTVPTASQND